MKNIKENNDQPQMYAIEKPDGLVCPEIAHSAERAWVDQIGHAREGYLMPYITGLTFDALLEKYKQDGYKCVKVKAE